MNEETKNLDLKRINQDIVNRSNVFYWQTDRLITPEEAAQIWTNRHRYFTDSEIIKKVNSVLTGDNLSSLVPLDLESQVSLGSINSVRIGKLTSEKEVIIRCHPKGIRNGYFHVESLASELTKQAGMPGFSTLEHSGSP